MAKQRTTAKGDAVNDDALAFRAAVRDVKPLAHEPNLKQPAKPGPRALRRKAASMHAARDGLGGHGGHGGIDADMPLIDPVSVRPDGAGDGIAGSVTPSTGSDPLTFQRAGVQNQVMRRLRRGLIPIEDELDLHGLTQSVARDHLAQFLNHSRDAGRRCVRIIHGKGYRSGPRGPILKIAVDTWLRRHGDVMAFTSARPIDGGTGAVYVLLRA
jgi:DNA-nicking Smr family endonuclease